MLAMFVLLLMKVKAQNTPSLPIANRNLFVLYSNMNLSIYELNYEANNVINKKKPVKAQAQDILPSSLASVNRTLTCKYLGNDAFELKLFSEQKIPIYLLRSANGAYKLYVKDGEQSCLLKKMSIKINKGTYKRPNYRVFDVIPVDDDWLNMN